MNDSPTVEARACEVSRPRIPLFKQFEGVGIEKSLCDFVLEKTIDSADRDSAHSQQSANLGKKERPLDYSTVKQLMTVNPHHSTCIHTKTSATVGLGFLNETQKAKRKEDLNPIQPLQPGQAPPTPTEVDPFAPSKVDDLLDGLCEFSFQDVLNDVCSDYWQFGVGYMEVVRRGDEITGIHHIPASDVWLYIEDAKHNFHWIISGPEGVGPISGDRHFAGFGDKEAMIQRASDQGGDGVGVTGPGGEFSLPTEDADDISEVIAFRQPSSLSKWYGFPDWVAAIQPMELVQCIHQHKHDFFLNRGVPEFMLFMLGQKLSDDEWDKVENCMKANIGLGNSHKSMALNIADREMVIQLEKLALEQKGEDSMPKDKEALALDIVSAHRVPPLLAGILIPGKLGATNELPNALKAFQVLVIGQAQTLFRRTLAQTLAGPKGVSGLVPEDFTFRTILDELDLDKMDTTARMRQTLPEAQAEGRDLSDGVKD